jgi:hypothetical protein
MKEKIINTLAELKKQGEVLNMRIHTASSTSEIDSLLKDYDAWDATSLGILEKVFVQPQLYKMFKGAFYLGNVNIDQNSFQGKRDRINYCLPKKLVHLGTAIAAARSAREIDLLPLEEGTINSVGLPATKNTDMKKLFISHSSLDDSKIKPLIDLINLIGVPHDKLFYCSIEGYGLSPGENLFDGLKKELNNEVFALFMLSKNFYESQICLCEMGAVWIKSHKQIPIVIPPMKYSEMKGVFPHTIGLELNNGGNMDTLKGQLEDFFKLPQMNITRWGEKRDEYLVKVNALVS